MPGTPYDRFTASSMIDSRTATVSSLCSQIQKTAALMAATSLSTSHFVCATLISTSALQLSSFACRSDGKYFASCSRPDCVGVGGCTGLLSSSLMVSPLFSSSSSSLLSSSSPSSSSSSSEPWSEFGLSLSMRSSRCASQAALAIRPGRARCCNSTSNFSPASCTCPSISISSTVTSGLSTLTRSLFTQGGRLTELPPESYVGGVPAHDSRPQLCRASGMQVTRPRV